MSNANKTQVGGTHYQTEYQHWDFVNDLDIPYIIANAIKYIARYKSKNGIEDLEKAKHYLQKAIELDTQLNRSPSVFEPVEKFASQYAPSSMTATVIRVMFGISRPRVEGKFQMCINYIDKEIGKLREDYVRG